MVRKAVEEVTPDDFGRFFAPGGIMDDFFVRNLQTLVDTSEAQWKWRDVNNAPLGISQDVLNAFQRAATIRERFFGAGGKQASVRFDLSVLAADPALTKLTLEIDGLSLTYGPDMAARPVPFQLPSGKAVNVVRFDATPPLLPELRTEGPWAWFRMIDKGVLESSPQGERFKLSFDLEGRKVAFDLSASSVNNPFKRDAVEQFKCPEQL